MNKKEYIKDKDAGKCYNAMDMYKAFKEKYPETDITYPLFKHIISAYNKKIVDKIIDGEIFNPSFNIGRMLIARLERNFNKKTVDWGETNKLKKQGINKIIYFTDDFYYRIKWDKVNCNLKNKTVYRFQPTYTFRKKLVKYIKEHTMGSITYSRIDPTKRKK